MPDEALDAQRPMSGDASQTAGAGDRRGRVQEGVRTRLRELSWFLPLRECNHFGHRTPIRVQPTVHDGS